MAFRTVPISATDILSGDLSGTYIVSGTIESANYDPLAGTGWIIRGDGSAVFGDLTAMGAANNLTVEGSLSVDGTADFANVVTLGNMVFDRVTITPTAANTPTSATITGLGLAGTAFTGQATAQTGVPGTTVTGVAVSSVTADAITVVLTRTNTTATGVFYQAIGQ